MRRVLIATHGLMASGAKSTLELIVGDIGDVECITAYIDDDNNIDDRLNQYFSKVSDEDELIVFTDLKEGSVNQQVLPRLLCKNNAFLVSGFNLPILIEVIMSSEKITEDILDRFIENSRNELCVVNLEKNVEETSDEEFLSF